jgi:hypothetical protein
MVFIIIIYIQFRILTRTGSGKKFRILLDPDPQHWRILKSYAQQIVSYNSFRENKNSSSDFFFGFFV